MLHRVVGQATTVAAGNSTAAASFMDALTQSFTEQYAAFNLVTQLSEPVEAVSTPTTPTAGGDHCLLSRFVARVGGQQSIAVQQT